MFKLIQGGAKLVYYPKTASTALSNGAIVSCPAGQLVAGTSTSTSHVGVLIRPIVSGDDDYASATFVPVLVPSQDALFEADATGLTTALVDKTMDLTDSLTVNGAADSHHAVTLVKYISATKGWFRINSLNSYRAGA